MEAVQTRPLKRSKKVLARKEAKALEPITQAKAHLRYLRMSPRKIKPVLDIIRGEEVTKANAILRHANRVACEPLIKLLNSAVANAEDLSNFEKCQLDGDNLYIAECFVCEGPTLKRIRPRAKGRAHRINKRTSHITIVLKSPVEN